MLIFSNCSLLWVSNIKTEIALSNINSEGVEFSNSVREFLPLKSLIKEVIDNLGMDSDKIKFVSRCIFMSTTAFPQLWQKI